MEKYIPKEGDFSLFKNSKKTDANHPDYTGKCFINGHDMRLAAWIKKGENGTFLTGKISEFQKKEEPAQIYPEKQDDLPF